MNSHTVRKIKDALSKTDTYEEWKVLALKHDELTGLDKWKKRKRSKLFDYQEIELRLNTLRDFRENGDDRSLLFTLNEGIHGNMGGMGNHVLYTKAMFGTKDLIVDYINEVTDGLLHLADFENTHISFEEKLDFFRRASICFGRSALMLSGGGRLGNFHIGVLKALAQQHLLPAVISGSSAGAIFAGVAGTKTDDELVEFLAEEQIIDILTEEVRIYQHIYERGENVKAGELEAILEALIPDLTFQEAFRLTGRKINISVAPHGAQQKSRLLNAIASPNVLIRSAIMASCAIPGIFPPVTLYAKNIHGSMQPYLPSRKWVDGSMSNDLPSKRLSRLYGVNHFIVSLTNPIVLPFFSDPSEQSQLMAPIRRLGVNLLRETTQFNYSVAQKLFPFLPKSAALAANTINSVVQQEYTGDINIAADFNILEAMDLLKVMSLDELSKLIKQGERASYPKIEAIRLTTKIGRTLDTILEEYEHHALIHDVTRGN